MILLSETQEYLYYGIPLPKDAYISEDEIHHVSLNSEILGVIGKDSEVSEEVEIEMGITSNYIKFKLLKDHDIYTDNPIEKPEKEKTWMAIKFVTTIEYDRWKENEDKLVKVVLIKVKK